MTPDQPPAAETVITVSRDDVLVILHQRPHTATEYGAACDRLAAAVPHPHAAPRREVIDRAVDEALAPRVEQIAEAAAAAERERIISIASQMRATIPADHPKGAQASFADYLRVTTETGRNPS